MPVLYTLPAVAHATRRWLSIGIQRHGAKPAVRGPLHATFGALLALSLWLVSIDGWAAVDPQPADRADRLAKNARQYEQDYRLQLNTAWLYYQAERYAEAEAFYRRALRLSEGSSESRLGLAWTLARADKHTQARALFRGLAEEQPYNASVLQGIRWSKKHAVDVIPSFALAYHHYANHPSKSWATTAEARLAFTWRQQLSLATTYRFSRFFTRPFATGTLGGDNSDFDQHEIHANVAYGNQRAGLSLHYAYLNEGSGWLTHSHVGGIAGRLTAFGDILAAASVSFYEDMNVLQGSAGWQTPTMGPLSLLPEVVLQHADGDLFVSGRLTGTVAWRWLSLWAGAKYGEQFRPTDLGRDVVYNIPEQVMFGLWGGVGVTLGKVMNLSAFYAIDQLELAEPPSGMRRSVAQYAGLRLSVWSLAF